MEVTEDDDAGIPVLPVHAAAAGARIHAAQMWVQQLFLCGRSEQDELRTHIEAIEILMDRLRQKEIRLQPVGPIPPGPWQDAGALRTGVVAPYFQEQLEEQLESEPSPSPVSSTGLSWPASASPSSDGDSLDDYGWPAAQPGSEGDEDESGAGPMDLDEVDS